MNQTLVERNISRPTNLTDSFNKIRPDMHHLFYGDLFNPCHIRIPGSEKTRPQSTDQLHDNRAARKADGLA